MERMSINEVMRYFAIGYIAVCSGGKVIEIKKEEQESMIDNAALYEMHERKEQERLDRLPVCECCRNPIQQEKAVYYNDQWFCRECEDEAWNIIRADYLEDTYE